MEETEILQRLKAVLRGRLQVDPEALSLDAGLAEIGVDSFSLVELIFVAEEEFAIKVPFEGLVVTTVQDVVATIARELAVQRAAS